MPSIQMAAIIEAIDESIVTFAICIRIFISISITSSRRRYTVQQHALHAHTGLTQTLQ